MNQLESIQALRAETPFHTFTRRGLLALGVVLVVSAQVILLSINPGRQNERLMQALAGSMFVIGALLFGALTPSALKLPRLEFPRQRVSQPALVWRNRWTLGWLSGAVVLAATAVGLFATHGESPTVVIIWLVSILALFVAQLRHVRIPRLRIAPNERLYLAVLALLLLIALITRAYNLTILPYNFDGDYADVGLQARALVTGQEHRIFAYGWAVVPMLGYLPPWLTMKVFGTGLAGLNASGVAEGLLIIVGVYLLGRDLFKARVGLFAAALLTISYTHLAASRQSSYIDPVVFLVFAVYFLLVGLREGHGWAIVASGALTALCVQMYYSGRLVVFMVGFILLYLLVFRRSWLWARKWAVLLWVLVVLITLGPMLVVFFRDSSGFMARTQTVFILNPDVIKHMEGVYHVNTISALLLEQTRHAVFLFNYYVDSGQQFALRQPFLDPFTAVLFILGLGYVLVRWRWLSYTSVLAWTVLGVVLGCFLTIDAPSWQRLLILLPPTALLAALALNQLYELANHTLVHIADGAMLIAPTAVTLLIIGVGMLNWTTYVNAKSTWATPRTRIARYLADQPSSTRAYMVSKDLTYKDREFRFLAPGYLFANLTPEQAEGEFAFVGTPTLLILTPEQHALLQQLQQKFPDGLAETHIGNTPTEIAFYVFRLP